MGRKRRLTARPSNCLSLSHGLNGDWDATGGARLESSLRICPPDYFFFSVSAPGGITDRGLLGTPSLCLWLPTLSGPPPALPGQRQLILISSQYPDCLSDKELLYAVVLADILALITIL